MKERFNHDCKTPEEAAAYLDARSKQLLRFGYRKIENIKKHEDKIKIIVLYFKKNIFK